jgi:hypothetical protein
MIEKQFKQQYKDNLAKSMKVLDLQLTKLSALNKHLYT